MKNKLVDVAWKSDREIVVKLVFEEKVLNVVCGYALRVGCEEKDYDVFWQEIDGVMQGIPGNEDACNRIATSKNNSAKEIVGENRSSMTEYKETWWWDEEVKRIIVSMK